MEFLYLILGIALLAVFSWILFQNKKRTGILHALLRFDTMAGIVAGIYLIVTSVYSLLF